MSKYGRSRKQQVRERKDKHEDYTNNVSQDASKWFKRKAYPHTDVIGYMKTKGFDVKGEMPDGRDQGAE